jgi:hypothetical protein
MDNQDIISSEKCKVKIAYNHEAFGLNSKQIPQNCKNPKQMKQQRQDKYFFFPFYVGCAMLSSAKLSN